VPAKVVVRVKAVSGQVIQSHEDTRIIRTGHPPLGLHVQPTAAIFLYHITNLFLHGRPVLHQFGIVADNTNDNHAQHGQNEENDESS